MKPIGLLSSASGFCLALAMVATSGSAVAQTGATQESQQSGARSPARLEEIVVTARRREERAQDVPLAVTALSAELQRPTVRDLSDLNAYAPNVRIDRDPGRAGGANISIRGISPTRTDDNSFDAPIGVMIDGIYLGSLAGQILENFDLERVEILRGPQGTLFGRNTVGGVVNVVRSRPTGEYGARVRLTAGRHDRREGRVVLNAPLIEDQLAGKFFGTLIQDDGFMFNTTTGQRQPERDYRNYGVTLLATPSPRFEALFTAERFDDKSDIGAFNTNFNLAPGVFPPPEDPLRETDLSGGILLCTVFGACRTSLDIPKTSEGNFANPGRTKVDAFTLNMQYQLNDNLTLVSVTGYRDMVEERLTDFDGTAVDFITIDRDNVFDQFSQEFRLEGSYDNVTFVTGLYYFESDYTQDWITGGSFWNFVTGGALGGDGVNPTPGIQACLAGLLGALRCDEGAPITGYGADVAQVLFSTQNTKAFAAFAQVDVAFAERWSLNAGLRWTYEKKDFLAGQAYLTPVDRARLRNFAEFSDLDNSWKEFSPRLGLSYNYSDDVMFYVSYAEGFHSGGFFGVNQNIADFQRDQYDPEFAKTVELGMKSQWLDNTLLVNTALFYNDFQDKQEQSIQVDPSTNTVATIFDNVASAIYWGAELEVQWAASDYLSLFTSIGYLNASFDEFETFLPGDQTQLVDASFLKPRRAPEWTLGLGGTFTIPVGRGFMELHSRYDWVDEFESDLFNARLGRISSRGNLNASVRYYTHDDRYSLTFFGRNITNKRTEVATLVFPLFAPGSVNQGYTWGLELEANF
jgi:iron complex outermembrane receptor protein